MKSKNTDDLRARTIKNFTDLLILKYLKKNPLSSGYEVLKHLHGTYNIIFSPGTIYHEIYRLERRSLIKGDGEENGRLYIITMEGEKTFKAAVNVTKQLQALVAEIFSEK